MSENEKLVNAVASEAWERGRARGIYPDMPWAKFRQINAFQQGLLDPLEKPILADARAAIAAVRAWDAEQGLVTVPREPTDRMVAAALPLAGESPDVVAKRIAAAAVTLLGTPDRVVQTGIECAAELVRDYRAMIAAADQGEGD